MTISQLLLPEFDQEMASTRRMLASVPDDKFSFKPHDKSMPLGRLASHVAEMPGWVIPTMEQDSLEMTPGQQPFLAASTAELVESFDKNVAAARPLIEGASDETFAKDWSFIYAGHKVFNGPKSQVIRGMVFSHLVHHRGQLSVYLRLMDIPVPGMYGPSADEKM
ncbi:MAG: hypothetical protein QOJ99_5422 [Bryobacterales bacterium]|jgi:uncharacterized damage-inducible protein DinB|nr:hypothetical protein [Bryobacterales bacterium]